MVVVCRLVLCKKMRGTNAVLIRIRRSSSLDGIESLLIQIGGRHRSGSVSLNMPSMVEAIVVAVVMVVVVVVVVAGVE